MSTPTAKDLLAQADRMMRQRTPEELPVLTDLVVEEIEIPSLTDRMDEVIPTHGKPPLASAVRAAATGGASAASHAPQRAASGPASGPLPKLPSGTPASPPLPAANPARSAAAVPAAPPHAPVRATAASAVQRAAADDIFGVRPRMPHDAPAPTPVGASPTTTSANANLRDQFNAQLIAKLEELQHSVFSQVMQQLELHAAGALKKHLRETLEPALMDIARDIADQVAEDTSTQVREVVSKAVDSEITRLREQLARRRGNPEPRT